MYYNYLESPIGKILLAGTAQALMSLSLPKNGATPQPEANWEHSPGIFSAWQLQLQEYFAGTRKEFTLPYILRGTTFQQQVLNRVAAVKYGTTVSYSDIAQQIAKPKAVRAIGMANARNPLPIIIPCHRVIGKNGSLTGFNGGLGLKKYLLSLEQSV